MFWPGNGLHPSFRWTPGPAVMVRTAGTQPGRYGENGPAATARMAGTEPGRYGENARYGARPLQAGHPKMWRKIAHGHICEGVLTMPEQVQAYPSSAELRDRRSKLAPGPAEAFKAFSQSVFAEGALSAKTKQLIAVAVAHVTQCPYCIRGHTQSAVQHGATPEEIMEAIWVAAEMRAGGAYAHSLLALDTLAHMPGEQRV